MPSDLEQTRLGYFNSGLALADQFGQGMELKLKRQQLASQEAARRIQERKLTADLEMIELEKQKLGMEIRQRAEADARWLNVDTRIKQDRAAFNTALEAGYQGPEVDPLRHAATVAAQLAPTDPRTMDLLKTGNSIESTRALTQQRTLSGQRAEQRIDNESTRLDLQRMGFSLRQVEQMMKASELGYEIQGQPAVNTPGASAPTLTPIQRPATTATLTQAQERTTEASSALASLSKAIQAIQQNPEALGVRGVIGQVVENVKGQINPRSTDPTPITDTRQKASIAFANVAKSLRVDSGNMSRYELTKLEQAGDVLSWEKGTPGALNQFANIQNAVIAQKLRYLKIQRAPVDNATLRTVPKSEFAELIASNLLTLEDVARAKKSGQLTQEEALAIFDSLQQQP